jgi:hypothetical protein
MLPSGFGAANVEAEIDFFEARVQRDGEAFDADFVEEEGDQGDVAARWCVGCRFVEVELDAAREVGREGVGRDFVLRHDQLAPLGGEEGGHGQRKPRLHKRPKLRELRENKLQIAGCKIP